MCEYGYTDPHSIYSKNRGLSPEEVLKRTKKQEKKGGRVMVCPECGEQTNVIEKHDRIRCLECGYWTPSYAKTEWGAE